jgi:hypothetical protein
MNMKTLKSIGAVLAGIFAGVILTVATDIVLHVTGVFPPLGRPMGRLTPPRKPWRRHFISEPSMP